MEQQEPSKYLKIDRFIIARQITYCTGQSLSQILGGEGTDGFTVQLYGQRTAIVRWIGSVDEEDKNLKRYDQALKRAGYQVRRVTEINVEPHSAAQKEQRRRRLNRELLLVQKLKPEFMPSKSKKSRQRRISRGSVHVR